MTDDPDFFAWLDGELADPQASAMAARVAADPQLAAFAAQHRALGARLTGAFAPIAAEPVPDRLQAMVRPAAEVVDLAARREQRRRWSLSGLAVAASLALGLGIGISLPRGDSGAFRQQDGQLLAASALDTALDRQLASAGEQNGVRIGLTFRDTDGRYCRTFASGPQSGLACRAGSDWAVEGLVTGTERPGDYRMASGPDPALAALVDTRLTGDPLDPAAERAAQAHGWR